MQRFCLAPKVLSFGNICVERTVKDASNKDHNGIRVCLHKQYCGALTQSIINFADEEKVTNDLRKQVLTSGGQNILTWKPGLKKNHFELNST